MLSQKEKLIKDGWVETTLGEVVEIQPGFAFKSKDFQTNQGFSVIKIKNIQPPIIRIEKEDIVDISEYPQEKLEKFKVKNGEYLIAMTGETIGKVGKYNLGNFAYINQRVCKIVKTEKSDYDFIYCTLLQDSFQKFINTHSFGAAQANISTDQIGKYKIFLPRLSEQKSIASILSSFDDKIALLREENKTLEEIGQTIFKEWFGKYSVDRPEELPEGWRVGKLGDLVLDSIGGDYGKETQDDVFNIETLCLRGTDLPDMKNNIPNRAPIRFVKDSKLEKCKLTNGDIVIEISGGTEGQSTGRSIYINDEIINRSNLPMTCVNFCRIIRPRKIEFSYFIYLYLEYLYNLGIFFNLENGSTGIKNLNLKVLLNEFDIVLPNEEVILDFNLEIKGFFEKIQYNNTQIQSLARSRDELLPKLMRGEVRVK